MRALVFFGSLLFGASAAINATAAMMLGLTLVAWPSSWRTSSCGARGRYARKLFSPAFERGGVSYLP